MLLFAALAVALLAAAPAEARKKTPSLTTPGFKGTTKVPKTVPAAPDARPVKVGVGTHRPSSSTRPARHTWCGRTGPRSPRGPHSITAA